MWKDGHEYLLAHFNKSASMRWAEEREKKKKKNQNSLG